METLHGETDHKKTLELQRNMEANGWVGAPLVVEGDQLINGTHRYIAARNLEIEIPTIELEELYIMAGLDMLEIHEAHGFPTLDEPEYADFLGELPYSIRNKYGIDLR